MLYVRVTDGPDGFVYVDNAENAAKCQWFALCDNPASLMIPHPILNKVPTCERCAKNIRSLK